MISASLALSSALTVAPLAPKLEGRHLASLIMQHDGKGFGGGEATRDPAPTLIDPNDPKGKQQAIHKAESFADYLVRRNGAAAPSGGAYPNLPPTVKPGVLTGQAVV